MIFFVSLRLIGRAGKQFSGPHSEIQPAKLTNHTARTNSLLRSRRLGSSRNEARCVTSPNDGCEGDYYEGD